MDQENGLYLEPDKWVQYFPESIKVRIVHTVLQVYDRGTELRSLDQTC